MTNLDNRSSVKIVARLLWLFPMLLFVISGFLFKAGFDQKTTLESGVLRSAKVLDVEVRNRADVTYGHIDLLIADEDGGEFEKRLPLPLSLLTPLEERKELNVRVLQDAAQEVMIEEVAHAQWRMSLIHSSMTFLGGILLLLAVRAWNRYIDQEGDPASRSLIE